MMDFTAAVFDLDGTLLDSTSVWDKIDKEFLEIKRNIPVPDDYAAVIAPMSFLETAEYTKNRFNLPDTPQELMAEWSKMAQYEYENNLKLKDGAAEYLQKLKSEGKSIILCTSSPANMYTGALKNNGVYDLFDGFADTCTMGIGKNSPDVFLYAAKICHAKPAQCLMFEDILPAAQSAKNAGMKTCGVYDCRSRSDEADMRKICDMYIKSFRELL